MTGFAQVARLAAPGLGKRFPSAGHARFSGLWTGVGGYLYRQPRRL
jgi:hypothetical protein